MENDGDPLRVVTEATLTVPARTGPRRVCVRAVDVFGFEAGGDGECRRQRGGGVMSQREQLALADALTHKTSALCIGLEDGTRIFSSW